MEEYKSTLNEDTKKLAKEELREDDATRENALRLMWDWVMKNPKIIRCRNDPSFFLRFLRSKKFSVPMAQEAIERYLLLRQSWAIAFRNLDYTKSSVKELLTKGYIFAAPGRDKFGRRWIIYRPGVFDLNRYTNEDMVRIHGVVYETMMENEENQIRGYVHFADGQGVSLPFLTLFTPKEAVRIVKNGERTIPMRHKEVHGINVPSSLKFLLEWGMTLVSDKIQKRVKVYTCIDEALNEINEFSEMLPKEYGGTMPMEEMIELFMKELEQSRTKILQNDENLEVKLEMFTEAQKAGAVSALKCGNMAASCNPNIDLYLTGSFRKLEVD